MSQPKPPTYEDLIELAEKLDSQPSPKPDFILVENEEVISIIKDIDDFPCDFRKGDVEPCKDCPRVMTALYRCGILQDIVND